jgi:hypothetical protein
MWLFSETGFVSAVVDLKDKDLMIVRGRDKKSLQPLAKMAGVKILNTPERDYPHRVFVSKEQFSKWVMKNIETMQYNNYKSRMYETRGSDFTHALSEVWSVMHQVSEGYRKPSYSYTTPPRTTWEDSYYDDYPQVFGKKSGK